MKRGISALKIFKNLSFSVFPVSTFTSLSYGCSNTTVRVKLPRIFPILFTYLVLVVTSSPSADHFELSLTILPLTTMSPFETPLPTHFISCPSSSSISSITPSSHASRWHGIPTFMPLSASTVSIRSTAIPAPVLEMPIQAALSIFCFSERSSSTRSRSGIYAPGVKPSSLRTSVILSRMTGSSVSMSMRSMTFE